MGITYELDPDRDVIFERWSGVVDATVLGDYWRRMLDDPDAMSCRRTLADIGDAEIAFTGPELRTLVRTIAEPRLAGRAWTTAVVVGAPVQLGVARQYQVFAENYSTDAVFEDADEALAWLLAQPHHADV